MICWTSFKNRLHDFTIYHNFFNHLLKSVFVCCTKFYFFSLITLFVHIFREVFKARDRKTKQVVAMKKVLMENEKEGVRIASGLVISFKKTETCVIYFEWDSSLQGYNLQSLAENQCHGQMAPECHFLSVAIYFPFNSKNAGH